MYHLDISLLRTFLDVHKTRHFGKTAENLYLTQSAVSARIKQLEELLGVTLFQRYRNNIQLTPQGERLVNHAELILNAWTQAVQDVALPEQTSQLVMAAPQSLWESRLSLLPVKLFEQIADLYIRTETLDSTSILRRLHEHTVDIGFIFDHAKTDDLVVENISQIDLRLYSSEPNQSVSDIVESQYVMVDWGQSFSALHAKHLPHIRSPRLHAADWLMAMEYLTQVGGIAFLPNSLVQDNRALYLVEDGPSMHREIFLCYHPNCRNIPNWSSILNAILDCVG